MQLWLWTNVETGEMGLGFAGNGMLDGEETNIVVMKPDMAVVLVSWVYRSDVSCAVCHRIPVVS
jgi:hypothetical protein